MLPLTLDISVTLARRFARRAVLLDAPLTLGAVLFHHGYIQIDPINVCGRMHDLIARNRVVGYQEGDLMRYLHGTDAPLAPKWRKGFEHHVPGKGILVAFPLDAWPYLLSAMRTWSLGRGAWAGRLTPREKTLAQHLLAEIEARGPLGSEDFDDPRRAKKVWGESKLVKATFQKLFFHGRVLIATRFKNRRRYDLPHRVLPASVLGAAEPTPAETARWLVLLKLRQRRLVTLKRDELGFVADDVQSIRVAGCRPLYCLRGDSALFDAVAADSDAEADPAVRLLAPLDPLVYDRAVTSTLWGFDYTWEAYTPAPKRTRGYYALPVLAGTELVGHIDVKAERVAGKLRIVGRKIRRGIKHAPAVGDLGTFLGVKR